MRRPARCILPVLCLAAASCSGGSSPSPAQGRISQSIGPTGGVLIGPPGTTLQGVEVSVPPGALRSLAELTLAGSAGLRSPDAQAAGPSFVVSASPDPGVLLLPLDVRVPVRIPRFADEKDLVLLVGRSLASFDGRPLEVVFAGKTTGGLSANRGHFDASVLRFGVYQPFLATRSRQLADAAALVARALAELEKRTESSIDNAGLLLEQAQLADPFDEGARFFAAVLRLLRLLNDRGDSGLRIDSSGELLESFGLRLGKKSLLLHLLDGDLPKWVSVPSSAPRQEAVLSFLDRVIRPELDDLRLSLYRIGDQFLARVKLPDLGLAFGGVREFDFGDLAALRALVEGAMAAHDLLASFDLNIDASRLRAKLGREWKAEQLLAAWPNLGRSRASRIGRAGLALRSALANLGDGFASIDAEQDDQTDDVIVIDPSMTAARRDEVLRALESLSASLASQTPQAFRITHQEGRVLFSLGALFSKSSLDLRGLLPGFRQSLPLGETLPDPTIAGLFPFLDRDEAVQRASIPTSARMVSAGIKIDGDPNDWPSSAEVLLPPDLEGDVAGSQTIPAVDGHRLFAATSATDLFLRLDLADGDPGFHAGLLHIYGLRIVDLDEQDRRRFGIQIQPSESGPMAWLFDETGLPGILGPGEPLEVALGPRTMEVRVPLVKLGDRARERLIHFRIRALDLSEGIGVRDDSRRVLIRF